MEKASIRWFDSMKGEGLVRLSDGSCKYIHFTAFYTPTDGNYHYPSETVQQWFDKYLINGTSLWIDYNSDEIIKATLDL